MPRKTAQSCFTERFLAISLIKLAGYKLNMKTTLLYIYNTICVQFENKNPANALTWVCPAPWENLDSVALSWADDTQHTSLKLSLCFKSLFGLHLRGIILDIRERQAVRWCLHSPNVVVVFHRIAYHFIPMFRSLDLIHAVCEDTAKEWWAGEAMMLWYTWWIPSTGIYSPRRIGDRMVLISCLIMMSATVHTTSLFSPVHPLNFFVCYFLSPFTDRDQQTNRTFLFSWKCSFCTCLYFMFGYHHKMMKTVRVFLSSGYLIILKGKKNTTAELCCVCCADFMSFGLF